LLSTQLLDGIDRLLISRGVINRKAIKTEVSPRLWGAGDLLLGKQILAFLK
jgi:hypothetical protein